MFICGHLISRLCTVYICRVAMVQHNYVVKKCQNCTFIVHVAAWPPFYLYSHFDLHKSVRCMYNYRYFCVTTHLVSSSGVAKQARSEVGNVSSYLLDHQLSHLTAPDGLRGVKLP